MNLEFFPPALEELLNKKEVIGQSGKKIKTGSVSTRNNLTIIRNLMMYKAPVSTLEIGLALGASALVICASHRNLKRSPNRQHTAIDPFQKTDWDEVALANLKKESLLGYIDVRTKKSCLELPNLINEQRKFDFVYIDGSHSYSDVFVDFYFLHQLVETKGIVLFDDSSNNQVAHAIKNAIKYSGKVWEGLNLAPFRGDRGRSLKYKIAQLVNFTQLSGFIKIK